MGLSRLLQRHYCTCLESCRYLSITVPGDIYNPVRDVRSTSGLVVHHHTDSVVFLPRLQLPMAYFWEPSLHGKHIAFMMTAVWLKY
jgi:hypothetical protein